MVKTVVIPSRKSSLVFSEELISRLSKLILAVAAHMHKAKAHVCHHRLDVAVRDAYGMRSEEVALTFLLGLNEKLAEKESNGTPIVAPGLPPVPEHRAKYSCGRYSRRAWKGAFSEV
jgi:hypothetical protein